MARQHHYRRRSKEAPDLDMTTFLNLMVVLVPFLLITAVFSQITIVELSLPSSAGGPAPTDPSFRMEVIVRDEGLELSNGTSVIATIPKRDDASVLLEPDIEYDHLIQVMDVVRSAERPGAAEGETTRVALFTDIAIGDAP